MPTYYPTGLGSSAGSDVATAQHFISSSAVYYVDPVNGSASNSGFSRADAKASIRDITLVAGITIVLMGDETLTCSIGAVSGFACLSVGVSDFSIVGDGATRPVLTLSGKTDSYPNYGIYAGGNCCLFDNIEFACDDSANSGEASNGLLYLVGSGTIFRNCKFSGQGWLANSGTDRLAISTDSSTDNVAFLGCEFDSDNVITSYGACTWTLEDCKIADNFVTTTGDAVFARDVTISDDTLANHSSATAGVLITDASQGGSRLVLPVSTAYYPNGFGSGYEDTYASARKGLCDMEVRFADSENGLSTNSGLYKTAPIDSLANALADIGSSDRVAVFLAEGHDERITSTLPAAGSAIVCAIIGQGSGAYMSKLTWADGLYEFDLTGAADTLFENIWFAESEFHSYMVARILVPGDSITFRRCVFDFGDYDICGNGNLIFNAASLNVRFEDCTFRSTATAHATIPTQAINFTAAAHLTMIDCTFDGGTYGFGGGAGKYAMSLGATSAGGHIIGLKLLNGARVNIANSTWKGFIADDSVDNASAGIVW
jgi:hypothetical protein